MDTRVKPAYDAKSRGPRSLWGNNRHATNVRQHKGMPETSPAIAQPSRCAIAGAMEHHERW
jgi:hypothetical protein